MVHETVKIMGDPAIRVTATTVRVPVFIGHSESVNIETERKLTADEARRAAGGARRASASWTTRRPARTRCPLRPPHTDEVFVGRIREDNSLENGLNLWIVVRQRAQGRGAQRRADCRAPGRRRPGARAMSQTADPRAEVRRHLGLDRRSGGSRSSSTSAARAPKASRWPSSSRRWAAAATRTPPTRCSTCFGPTAARWTRTTTT